MKTSSVEFISRSPNPLPMKSEHRRFVLLRKIFEPWQWKRRKKRNRFEQTPELYRGKYRCILLWSPWKYRCGQRTVRMAVVTCSQNQAVFARRRIKVKAELKLKKETLEKKLGIRERKREAAKENARGARAGIVRVHYFVRGGFVGYRSRASSKHLSPHLPVGSLDSSGGSNRVCAASEVARVGVESTKKPTPDVVVVFET
ncbi:hypothetical protein TNCV_231131 [Trichonephila clavipes]|nr:hypothetical protein TNCV_231131 [Trichonephila clavipes]